MTEISWYSGSIMTYSSFFYPFIDGKTKLPFQNYVFLSFHISNPPLTLTEHPKLLISNDPLICRFTCSSCTSRGPSWWRGCRSGRRSKEETELSIFWYETRNSWKWTNAREEYIRVEVSIYLLATSIWARISRITGHSKSVRLIH